MTAASVGAAAEAIGVRLTAEERYQLAADGNALLAIVRESDQVAAFEEEPAGFALALERHAPCDEDA